MAPSNTEPRGLKKELVELSDTCVSRWSHTVNGTAVLLPPGKAGAVTGPSLRLVRLPGILFAHFTGTHWGPT